MQNCSTIYETTIPWCPLETLAIAGNFPAGIYGGYGYADMPLKVAIQDKHGKQYWQDVSPDEEGRLVLDMTSDTYPEGLLNPYGGTYILTVYEEDGCTPVPLVFCDQWYDHVAFRVVDARGDITEAEIKCCA